MAHRRSRLCEIRAAMRAATLEDESRAVRARARAAGLEPRDREAITAYAVELVRITRARSGTSVMQGFLAEYGLSTREGVALMCLAEALLRVPDTETIDALIEDKIGASNWAVHLGHSSSPLVNASTWALLLTGKVLGEAEEGLAGALKEAIRRLGEPVIRAAVAQAMRELGAHFVLGVDMREARKRAAAMESEGCTLSYDMLGEAARTEADARRYHLAYSDSISALAGAGGGAELVDRPGVSVKLSALHARYEFGQRDRVMTELVARLRSLALLAQSAGIGLSVDAEESERLDLSLDVVDAVNAAGQHLHQPEPGRRRRRVAALRGRRRERDRTEGWRTPLLATLDGQRKRLRGRAGRPGGGGGASRLRHIRGTSRNGNPAVRRERGGAGRRGAGQECPRRGSDPARRPRKRRSPS